MHIKTSTHILSLAEDHIYNLRRIGVLGDDSWLEARKGEAYNRHLQVRLKDNALHLNFEGSTIGSVSIANPEHLKSIIDFVQHWNLHVGPTDMLTTRTIELVRDWAQLLVNKELKMRCVTWNCAGLLGEQGLKVETWMRLLGSEPEAAQIDLIVLSFQESDNLNRSVKSNPITLQRSVDLSTRYLYKTHKLVSSVQLLGLMTLTFVRNELAPFVSNVRTDTSSTGFLRMWGNKGAVLTRFHILRDEILGGGLELSIVNCHLSAGEGVTQLGRRRWELKEISSKFDVSGLAGPEVSIDEIEHDADSISSVSSDEEKTDRVLSHPHSVAGTHSGTREADSLKAQDKPAEPDLETETLKASNSDTEDQAPDADNALHMGSSKYTIVMGDLNYRVLMPESEAQKKVQKQQWDGLLANESLILERQKGEVFRGFEEAAIAFPPTYKYEIGSTKLKGRVPSYTDRILYRTRLAHTVNNYVSLTDLKSSDHRPVALLAGFTVPNVVDNDKRLEVLGRAMKLSDEAENNVRPKISVDVQQVLLKGPPLSLQSHRIVIRNEGTRPVDWVIQNAEEELINLNASVGATEDATTENDTSSESQGHQDAKDPDNSAPLEKERGVGKEGATTKSSLSQMDDIKIYPPNGEVSLTRPTSCVTLEAKIGVSPRDYILLVKPDGNFEGGVHQYVFVHVEPTPSYLGATLKSMPQIDGIPVPVRRCVEYLWGRNVPDMFLHRADPQLFQQVLYSLDHDEPFDEEKLAAEDEVYPNASVYAVSNALMSLFQYLPEQLMGPGPKRKGATKDWNGVTTYVCRFISHTTENEFEEPSLNVWANLLYDRTDKRAGANEKRAYLRSMLIVAAHADAPPAKQGRSTQPPPSNTNPAKIDAPTAHDAGSRN